MIFLSNLCTHFDCAAGSLMPFFRNASVCTCSQLLKALLQALGQPMQLSVK